jgi:hypothetical protein
MGAFCPRQGSLFVSILRSTRRATRQTSRCEATSKHRGRQRQHYNVALADAAITTWEAKYTYDLWRPVTAINLGDLDGNPLTVADPSWRPLIVTTPFPEYTPGHSTFSGAAAAILTAKFGENYAFTTGTSSTDPAVAGVTRDFSSFTEAAEEAGRSRIYGGIHTGSLIEHVSALSKFGSRLT